MVNLSDDKSNYLIVRVKDIYFDENVGGFIRKYDIRKITDFKLDTELKEISNTDIESFISLEEVKATQGDLEYVNQEDKDSDLQQDDNVLESLDSMPDEEIMNDIDLDIDIDMEDNRNNANEDGFEFEEVLNEDVILDIEQELEESKILFTENEQEEDIIDEMIRKLSDRKKQDRSEIKNIIKLVRKFQYLKDKHSESGLPHNQHLDEDQLTILKQNIIIKTSNYKPLLHQYNKNDHSNPYLIPIINSSLIEYYDNQNEESKDKLSDVIQQQIETIEKIHTKYKNNKELDYESMSNEIENLVKDKEVDTKYNTQYLTRFNKDTGVINNLDITEEDPLDSRVILGNDIRDDVFGNNNITNKGERVNIIGYVRLPNSILDKGREKDYLKEDRPITNIQKLYLHARKNYEIETKTLDHNNRYQIGDRVKVCIPDERNEMTNIEIIGKIMESRRGFIYVEPEDEKLINKNSDILEFNTNSNLLKISKVEDIKSHNDTCTTEADLEKITVYEFPSRVISAQQRENMLDQIVPSIKQILDREYSKLKNVINIAQVNSILSKYNLRYSDLEYRNQRRIDGILTKNEKKSHQKGLVNISKINRDKATYFKDLKDEQEKRKKNDFSMVSNLELQSAQNVYSEYIYNAFSFDSDIERVDWLHYQEDRGKFIIYNKILLKIQAEKRKIKLSNLKGRLEEVNSENEKIKIKLEEEKRKNDFFNADKENKCRDITTKIVKIYKNLHDLKQDDNRKINVDDYYLIGDISNPVNLVSEGDYCILKHPDDPNSDVNMNDKIFKRITTGSDEDKKELWALDSKLKIADYLREAKALCASLLEESGNPAFCKLDIKMAQCLPERVQRLKKGFENNEQLIIKLEEQIEKLGLDEKEKLLETQIKYYQLRGQLNMKNDQENIKKRIKKIEELEKEIPLEIETADNENFEYLKQLNQDINDPQKKQVLLLNLKEKYGIDFIEKDAIEGEDPELFTQGDFDDKGQRIEVTEVMPYSQKEEIESSNSDILDAIRTFLNDSTNPDLYEDTYHNDDVDLMETIKGVITTIVNIMGVKIELDKIDKVCAVLVDDNLMSKSEYINQKYLLKDKPLPKSSKVDSQYNSYRLQIILFLTVCRLLIHLQINLTNYFMLPYQKCISSIYGYPLVQQKEEEEMNTTGIDYMSCILDNLKDSGKYWACLEEYNKSKISKKILSYMEVVLGNNSIVNDLEMKFTEVDENRKQMDLIEQEYVWNEFRPPLQDSTTDSTRDNPPTVDLGDTDIKNTKKFDNAVSVFQERSLWISLKIVDRINSIITSQEIENVKYDPLPIANSCCLSQINNNYKYADFLNKNDINKDLQSYIDESRSMEFVGSKLKQENQQLIYVVPTNYRQPVRSYKYNIFPNKKQITKNTKLLKSLFTNFIDSGFHTGIKRLYQDNVCSYTGDNLPAIESKAYSVDNFTELLTNIHKRNYQGIQVTKEEEMSIDDNDKPNFFMNTKFILRKLQKAIQHPTLISNDFIKELLEKDLVELSEKENLKTWEILEREVKNTQDDLLAKLGRHLDKTSVQMVKNIITNMEMYENQENMDSKILDDTEPNLQESAKKDKLLEIKNKRLENQLRRFILNYLCKYVYILSNDNPELDLTMNLGDGDETRLRKTQRTLSEINMSEYELLNKFRNKKCRRIFKQIRPHLRKINQVNNIKGYHNIYDNQNILLHKSQFDSQTSYRLLKLIFFHLLNNIIDLGSQDKSGKQKSGKKSPALSLSEDDEEADFEVGTSNAVLLSNYVLTIFRLVDKDRTFINKYSQNLVDKNIKTRNEEAKDRNLHVMELLDLETRRLRNEQTKVGLTKYADLSSDFKEVIDQEQRDNALREQYKRSMGENYTDDGFEAYKDNKIKEDRLEQDIRRDNEDYLDAEGDDEMEL